MHRAEKQKRSENGVKESCYLLGSPNGACGLHVHQAKVAVWELHYCFGLDVAMDHALHVDVLHALRPKQHNAEKMSAIFGKLHDLGFRVFWV